MRRRWYDFERNRELTRFEEWSERGPVPGSEPTGPFADSDWRDLLKRDPCSYCGRQGGTVDHIVLKLRRTGLKRPQKWLNFTGACFECNHRKASSPLLMFLLSRRPESVEAA